MKRGFLSLFLFFSLYCSINCDCQPTPEELNILNSNNADFSKVLTGQAVCTPASLSFGTAVINDARSFFCMDNNGKTIWEKKLKFASNSKLYSLQDDFLAVTTKNDSILTVYNSSGIEIFKKDFAQPVAGKIVQGFDTRLFIPFSDRIECYSVGGIKKWELSVEKSYNGMIFTLQDGSIAIQKNNYLLRLSPFGEILEATELTDTSDKINSINQCKNGILVQIQDENPVYFTANEGTFEKKWTFTNTDKAGNKNLQKNQSNTVENIDVFYNQSSNILVLCSFFPKEINIHYLDENTGKTKSDFTIEMPSAQKTSSYKFALNQNGFLVIDDNSAEFYDNFGTIAWKKTLSDTTEEKPDYVLLKNNNSLLFFCPNWSINYFTVIKKNSSVMKDNYSFERHYDNFYNTTSSASSILFSGNFKNLSNQFLQGDFENNEKYYIETLLDFYKNYTSALTSTDFGTTDLPSQFETDINSCTKLINLSFRLQTTEFTDYIVQIIRNEKNPAVLEAVLQGISNFGYDSDFSILKEMNIRAKKITGHEENLIPFFCSAVTSICKIMGKPAFEQYGNRIISTFFSEQFSPDAKATARNAYLKISRYFQYN